MFSTVLDSVTAVAAVGGFVLALIGVGRSRSKTRVEYRWELADEHADVPCLLDPRNFENSLRAGATRLFPGRDDIYADKAQVRLVVRVSRQGGSPTSVEYVELGDPVRQAALIRQPGQIGIAVRTIDPNSHAEWVFYFADAARALQFAYPNGDFPDLVIRVAIGGGRKNPFAKAPNLPATQIRSLMAAITGNN